MKWTRLLAATLIIIVVTAYIAHRMSGSSYLEGRVTGVGEISDSRGKYWVATVRTNDNSTMPGKDVTTIFTDQVILDMNVCAKLFNGYASLSECK